MAQDLKCETCRHLATFYTVPRPHGTVFLCGYAWPASFRISLETLACEHYEPMTPEKQAN